MDNFRLLCTAWHEQVKAFFTSLHGHQRKTLAMFVMGAIRAESIVLQRVAEALLARCVMQKQAVLSGDESVF